MAHICGFCSNCMDKVMKQPGAVYVELRDVICAPGVCCSCDLSMPQIWAATAKDVTVATLAGAGPLAVKHHGQIQTVRGTKRS
jgi:hypothetical protein